MYYISKEYRKIKLDGQDKKIRNKYLGPANVMCVLSGIVFNDTEGLVKSQKISYSSS